MFATIFGVFSPFCSFLLFLYLFFCFLFFVFFRRERERKVKKKAMPTRAEKRADRICAKVRSTPYLKLDLRKRDCSLMPAAVRKKSRVCRKKAKKKAVYFGPKRAPFGQQVFGPMRAPGSLMPLHRRPRDRRKPKHRFIGPQYAVHGPERMPVGYGKPKVIRKSTRKKK